MKKEIPCGRTADTSHLCCKREHTIWNQRVVLEFPKFYWHKGLRFNIGYKIYCKECGSMTQQGNKFKLSEYLRGEILF